MSDENKHKAELNDSVRLAIRDEVEKRLGDEMPGSLSKYIDDEVEKRVELRVGQYRNLAIVFLALVSTFAAILWHQTIVEAGETALKTVAGTEAVKAGQKVIALASDVEKQSQRASNLTDDLAKNHDDFLTRLDQLRQRDNAVLLDKDGSLTLKGPVRFAGEVKFDRSLFSGTAYIKGSRYVVKGSPAPFVRVGLGNGEIEYTNIMPNPQGGFDLYYDVAHTFGDIVVP